MSPPVRNFKRTYLDLRPDKFSIFQESGHVLSRTYTTEVISTVEPICP